jgi:hypothetical protein
MAALYSKPRASGGTLVARLQNGKEVQMTSMVSSSSHPTFTKSSIVD